MGSTQGGTVLNIDGQSFSHSTQHPIVVNIAGEVCTILNVTVTKIQCKTPLAPSGVRNQYQG